MVIGGAMAWGEADFYDGARSQGHELGVTRREAIEAARLAEFVMTNVFAPSIDRGAVLREFGFASIEGAAAGFFAKVIAGRPKRPREVVAFFVVRPKPHEGVRYIGFSSMSDYKKDRKTLDEALGLLAYFAGQV
jgi:hypothetical protein